MEFLSKELEDNLNWISSIGADPTGGISRLWYSNTWLEAQNGLKEKFESVGLTAKFDSVGNLYGRIEGSMKPEETIATGSHVDTVVRGGRLDGQFGVIGGYLAIKYLLETYGKPLRSLEIISFAEEEGSRFPFTFWGSKNLFGLANKQDVIDIADASGKPFVDAMKEVGFDFRPENEAVRQDLKAFVELHIEQGSVLERNCQPVGIVTGIVGQKRYNITLKGQANHAGTTPMGYRKDAVYGFSRICCESIAKAKLAGDPLVLTFGKVIPKPNTVNVVPGEVLFTMDCRHTDEIALAEFTKEIENDMKCIAKELDMEIDIDLWMNEKPVPMDTDLIEMLKSICDEEKINYRVMHSGAGHDAQIVAPRVPTVMFFVPSIDGISHNPAENTKTEDLIQGMKALTATLYKLAYV